MSYRFTSEELLLISRAVASYQHNAEFQTVIEKVEILTSGERTKSDFYSPINPSHADGRLTTYAR